MTDKYYKTHNYNTITSGNAENQAISQEDQIRYSGPILMAMKVDPEKNPREETFGEMLKINCCPSFKWLSFTVIITIIDIIMFIVEICFVPKFHGEFLSIDTKTIYQMGSSYPYDMKRGHIWLFITPVFLHGNLEHLVSNMIVQVIFGANLEGAIGWLYLMIIYFCTAISGNLASVLVNDALGVGATFGIIGMLVGGGNVDHLGHTGGFVIGLTLTIGIVPKLKDKYEIEETKRSGLQIFCLVFTILFYVLGFLIFYTMREPQDLSKEIEKGDDFL